MLRHSEDGLEGGNKSLKHLKDIIIKHADRHNLLHPDFYSTSDFLSSFYLF